MWHLPSQIKRSVGRAPGRIVFSRAMQLNRRRFLATEANARAGNFVLPDWVREEILQAVGGHAAALDR